MAAETLLSYVSLTHESVLFGSHTSGTT